MATPGSGALAYLLGFADEDLFADAEGPFVPGTSCDKSAAAALGIRVIDVAESRVFVVAETLVVVLDVRALVVEDTSKRPRQMQGEKRGTREALKSRKALGARKALKAMVALGAREALKAKKALKGKEGVKGKGWR